MVIERQSLFPARQRSPSLPPKACLRRASISAELRSSRCVAIAQTNPNGSLTSPYRSPQNCSRSGIVTEQPALRLFAQAASASGRYRVNRIGHSSGTIGFPPNSGNTSFNIMTDSPMRTLAFSKRPSGEAERVSSTASKALLQEFDVLGGSVHGEMNAE